MNLLVVRGFAVQTSIDQRIPNLVSIDDSRNPTQCKKCLWHCGNRKPVGGLMIVQDPQTHMVACADQLATLEVDDDDGESAEDPLERAVAPAIEQTKRHHAVGHRMQIARRNAQNIAELGPVIDATIK